MTRKHLTIIDPVKPLGRTYSTPIAIAGQRFYETKTIVRPSLESLPEIFDTSDAIWIDWAVEHAVIASHLNKDRRKKLWIRVQAFEVLEGRFCQKVLWENVSGLIAYCEDVLNIAKTQSPKLNQTTKTFLVPNGIDCTRFYPSPFFDPFHIAWVGEITPKKIPQIAIHVLDALRSEGGNYRLSMAGDWVSDRTIRHLRHTIDKLGLQEHVNLDGHVTNMPEWFRNKGVLLSTSLYESFGFAIGEAASAGLAPVIFGFPNDNKIWPETWLVNSFSQACQAIRQAQQGCAREYVLNNYPLDQMIERIASIIRDG